MIMTPTHTDSPLRRSEVGSFRTPVQTPVINDDDEERRQARRRTAFEESTPSSTIEDNETLKNCLKIYNENKLSKENAWSVSVIDTLSTLLDKHHKSLSNFKVAGSSLEASSKVYGLRVDSIHTDVVRLSSGLNKQKFAENDDDDDDNDHRNGENSNEIHNDPGADGERQTRSKPKKRARKLLSTITKNKETINGRLDTNPFTDPIFAKLNSIVGSINSSNRLLQNMLPSIDSELRLRMDYMYWDSLTIESITYPEEYNYEECSLVDCKVFDDLELESQVLRPNHTGYIITDAPAEQDDDDRLPSPEIPIDATNSQMAVAFDINADVEPIPADTHTFVDVDMGDLDELTTEDRVAINNCRGLRRVPVLIEDMRPIDSTSSTLEYSYRPLDKISQFWAGPSHWKFKRIRNKSLSLAKRLSTQNCTDQNSYHLNQRGRRKLLKNRVQQLQFCEVHDDLFQKVNEKSKLRKVNIQKKWDAKKFKLPTDLQIDRNLFDVYRYAPGIPVQEEVDETISASIPLQSSYDYQNPVDKEYCSNIQNDDYTDSVEGVPDCQDFDELPNQTVVEIATDFAGAPDKVTKIIVPFAKRAKVIDMKQLKKCCMNLIQKQFINTDKENIPQLPEFINEKYKNGLASFNQIYSNLPKLLTQNMAESLSPSVAFYSILHLANESQLRLIPQEDLKDFNIRQLDE